MGECSNCVHAILPLNSDPVYICFFRNGFCAHDCAGIRLLVKWVKQPEDIDLVGTL